MEIVSPDEIHLLMPGDIPSPPRKNRAHYNTVNSFYTRLFRLRDSADEYGVETEHCEELDGIAQNIIDLDLGISTDLMIETRRAFNDYWEQWGSDIDNFNMLFDCCCDILAKYLHPNVDVF